MIRESNQSSRGARVFLFLFVSLNVSLWSWKSRGTLPDASRKNTNSGKINRLDKHLLDKLT
jgi:hypothetical protein